MQRCFSCHNLLTIEGRPARADTCPNCTADVKCCLNCAFFDATAYNECGDPSAERVVIKDRSNFCDFFRFGEDTGSPKGENEAEDNLKKLKDLFTK